VPIQNRIGMIGKLKPFIVSVIISTLMITLNSCGNLDGVSSLEVDSSDTERDIKTALLVGIWESVEYNGIAMTEDRFFLKFEANGDFEEYSTYIKNVYAYEGEWEWNSDLTKTLIEYDGGDEAILNVIEIDENQFIFRADGDRYTFEKVE